MCHVVCSVLFAYSAVNTYKPPRAAFIPLLKEEKQDTQRLLIVSQLHGVT